MIFMFMTAFVLAEICSALPLSGSIYVWAAESAGPKYARFFGFIVAWWSCTAWMTFAAGNCQVRASSSSEGTSDLTQECRLLQTISSRNLLSGRWNIQEALATITSNGALLSGPYQKASSYVPLQSTTFHPAGTLPSSGFPWLFT